MTKLCYAAVFFCFLASSCSRDNQAVKAESTPAGTSEPLTVPVALVRRADISNDVLLTAEFEPFQEIDLMAKVSGYVRSIKVDLGDHVRAGQLLAELEVPEMRDDLARAAAAIDQTDADIAVARDEVKRSESAYAIAHLSFGRVQDVAKRERGLIPQQEVDEAQSKDSMAEAQVAAAKSRLRAAEQRTQVAKADQARTRTMNRYVSITAPFSGTITRRFANTGSMIQAGTASQSQAMPLVRLSQNSVLRLRLPVPESMVPSVRVGQSVDVRVSSLNRSFAGRVARYAGKVDTATRTMITEVDVPNGNGVLLPGMYAEVNLSLQIRPSALSVPLEAIDRNGSATRVYRVTQAGTVQIVPIKLGAESANRAEILSGLAEGDQVVVGTKAALKQGDVVRPQISSGSDSAGMSQAGH